MSTVSPDRTALYQSEYELRLVVHRLRREVYTQSDPSTNATLLNELVTAEQALETAATERAAAQAQDTQSGLLLDTAGESIRRGRETTGLEAKVHLAMTHVPTAIYHLLDCDDHPLITCEVTATRTDNPEDRAVKRRVRVTSFIEGYSARAVNTFELAIGQPPYQFKQLPTLFLDRIRDLNELTRATLNILVENLDGKVEIHETAPIWLLARTSVPYAVMDPKTGTWQDLSRYYGAFVTPNAPSLMKFLRIAAAAHPAGRLVGYQGAPKQDPQIVPSQVKAIFNALKQTGEITYVNSLIDVNPEQGTASQRVRLPRESLADQEANCIDGAVLFASLLEGISLHPALVLVPGHAFVAWETWTGSNEWKFLETTMIGNSTFEEACTSAEQTATYYKGKMQLTIWPLKELRTKYRITPME